MKKTLLIILVLAGSSFLLPIDPITGWKISRKQNKEMEEIALCVFLHDFAFYTIDQGKYPLATDLQRFRHYDSLSEFFDYEYDHRKINQNNFQWFKAKSKKEKLEFSIISSTDGGLHYKCSIDSVSIKKSFRRFEGNLRYFYRKKQQKSNKTFD